MTSSTLFAPLFVMAGLAAGAVAAPVPPPALAEAQLRAINHRFVDAFVAPQAGFMEALTGQDFLLTAGDGAWVDRSQFLARMQRPPSLDGVSYDDVRVRLYGTVALVQGVFEAVQAGGGPSRVRYTDVFVWNGAAWQLVSAQNTPLKPGVQARRAVGAAHRIAPWTGQDPTGDDLDVLRTLNDRYVQAFREADVAWYEAHLASDYDVVSGDGSFQDRAAALADFAKPTFATHIKAFPVGRVSIRRFDDVALVHAENDYEMKDGRRGVSRYTDIWHKQDGRWWCIAAHITVHKAPSLQQRVRPGA